MAAVRWRGAVVACAVAIGLTACSDGGTSASAESGTTASSAGSPSASDTGVASSVPAAPSSTAGPPPAAPPPAAAPAPAAQAMTVTATEMEFGLDGTDLSAGEWTITLTNRGRMTHDLVVEQDGEDVAGTDRIGPGESTTLTVTLAPGRYVFYCSVGNHRAMGMETEVTVS